MTLLGSSPAYAAVEAHIRIQGGAALLAIGDTATFEIWMNPGTPYGKDITGYEFYLTFDPTVFKPLFADTVISISDGDTTITYQPFSIGELILGHWEKNNTRGDEWSDPYPDPDLNLLAGFQLDYSQHTAPSGSGRESFAHSGVAGTFVLTVIGVPPTGTATITFDDQYIIPTEGARQTRYYPKIRDPKYGNRVPFNILGNLDILIGGLKIRPVIPDTVVTPGTTLRIILEDHFLSGMYDPDEVTWTLTGITNPGGTNAYRDDADTSLVVTSLGTDQCYVDLTVKLESNVPLYTDSQPLRVTVDNRPVFDQDLSNPLLFTFDEDTQLPLDANADIIGGVLFTDQDDNGPDLTIWLEPSSPINLSYDNVNTVTFDADTNWFGSYQARLFVEDVLGVSADTLLTFTVNPVNDAPIFNLDSLSGLGDTLVIHHKQDPTVIDLKDHVSDEENDVLSGWTIVSNSDPTSLPIAALTSEGVLTVDASDSSPLPTDVLLVLQVSDNGTPIPETTTDTLVVSIRPYPPEIVIVENIKINSQDAPSKRLNLADWVIDLDTPPAAMTWSFRALDAVTGAVDPYVTFAPSNPLTGDTVNIGVTQAYAATDLLEMTVTDDAGYSDIDTARLFIFDGDAPMIYPLPSLTIYRDTTYTGILDLDDYVADIQDNPAAIGWTSFGGDSLESFVIDLSSHEITITTNTTFIGNLIVSLVAINSRGLRDTSDLAILVSRVNDGPPLWYAVPDVVEVVYGWTTDLFTYGQICYDETPTDSILFTPYYEADSLTVTVPALTDSVQLTTPLEVKDETTYLYFSAEDDSGRVSYSDTITVLLKDSFSPDWQRIPTISLNIGETYSGLFLRDYVSDRDTPDNLLTIDVVNLNSLINVSYNSVTSELTVSAGSRPSDSWLIITATDDKGNTDAILVYVQVIAVGDYTPPDGGLTYFFNSATDRWIHYVAVADSTTDISSFTWDYSYGTPPKDYSYSLSFVMQDSLPGTLTWIAPYHFQNEGSYRLSVNIVDASINLLEISPIILSVGFSKAIGGVLASPDQQLTVSYPPAPITNGKLLIISEDTLPDSAVQPTTEITETGVNEEAAGPMPATVYALNTNLPEPILVTLTYHQKRDTDPYYSFYELDGDQLVKIETYTSTDGYFEAAATLDRDIVFAPSDTPARNAPLPGAELLCYPNPFNATIQVRFLLRWPDQGRIVIYDLLGREVYATPRQPLEPGVHAFSWHSIDSRGIPAPSGVYFIRLETDGGKIVTRKVMLLK